MSLAHFERIALEQGGMLNQNLVRHAAARVGRLQNLGWVHLDSGRAERYISLPVDAIGCVCRITSSMYRLQRCWRKDKGKRQV